MRILIKGGINLSKGRIIVIEGCDGCGKETQSKLLQESLRTKGIDSIVRSFPSYGQPQAGPVEIYLSGKMGDINDMTSQQISILFIVDMFTSYRVEKWDEILDSGTWIIMDRYVESNILYQASKCDNMTDAFNIIRYITNKGYTVFGLPKPDYVFYLDLSNDISTRLLNNRGLNKDLHESNYEYMKKVHEFGLSIANTLEWNVISCDNEDRTFIKDKNLIQQDILTKLGV